MAGIPGIRQSKFYEKKGLVELMAIGPPILAAIIAACTNLADRKTRVAGYWMIVGIVWLLVGSIIKVLSAYQQDKEQQSKQDYDGLLGAIHVLYGQVSKHLKFQETDAGRLRITIHRMVVCAQKDQYPEELEQLLPYIGGDGKQAGRRFSIRSGIIGKAVREKTPYAFTRQNDDYEAFIKELVALWSYPEEDARKLTSDRRSWMSVPIFGPNTSVVGVVYLDSNEKDFFSPEVQNLVINACSGIASYIDERYKSS